MNWTILYRVRGVWLAVFMAAMTVFIAGKNASASVQFLWSGAVTCSTVTVKGKVSPDSARVRVAVSTQSDLSAAVYSTLDTAITAENNRVATGTVGGLLPGQHYYYALEVNDTLEISMVGQFRTFPLDTGSFMFAFSSCAATGSNHAVFDTIRGHNPLFFLHTGDFHYLNISVNNRDTYRSAFETVLAASRQAALYRSCPFIYIWDDHDFGPNNSDSTAPGRTAARLTYQEYVPHYPLAVGSGDIPIYYSFAVGRVYFIVCDSRSARSPASAIDDASKTMLGIPQKAWFKDQLLWASRNYPLIVWVNSLPWIGLTGDDGWHLYTNERREIADFIKTYNIHNLCMLSGDAHMLAIDDGTNSDYATGGGAPFPVMQAASLDQTPSLKGGPYSEGAFPNRYQYGLMTVTDGPDSLRVHWSGTNYLNQVIVQHDFAVVVADPLCGDADWDRNVNVADAVYLINYIFKNGPGPVPLCVGDANGDSKVNVGDAIFLLQYVFKGGTAPVAGCCPN